MKKFIKIPLITALLLFMMLCASCAYWVMQIMTPPARKVSAPPPTVAIANVDNVATLFGGALAVVSNYQLKGIVLANPNSQSVAIIAVDGKPAQAYPINSELSAGVKLTEVQANQVLLMDNGVPKRITLPSQNNSMNPSAGMINYSAMGNSGIGGISGIGVPVIQNPASNGSANRAAGNINNVGNPQPISGANSAMNGVPNAALNSAIPASARPSLAPNNPSTPPDFGASPPVVSNTPPIAH